MAWKKEQSAVYGSANKISDVFGKSPFLQFFTQYGNPTNGSGSPTSVIVFGTDTLNDVANQYCKSQGQAGAADVEADETRPAVGLGGAGGAFCILFMGNVSGFEKIGCYQSVRADPTGVGSSGSSSSSRTQGVVKWINTSGQINITKQANAGGSYDTTNDNTTILGSNNENNFVDGTVFEETDTGKSYIWNATTKVWTEIT